MQMIHIMDLLVFVITEMENGMSLSVMDASGKILLFEY